MRRDDADEVVVVGAGPAGLATALTLGAHGVATTVVERRLSTSELPRANALSTGTMELLRRWGLETTVRERALDVEMRPLAVPVLAAAEQGEPLDAGFPSREQAALVSPTAPTAVGQDELEPLLEERVRSFPSVRVVRGVDLVALERDGIGHVVTLAGPDGSRRRLGARYVVGADGTQSTVRRHLGIATDGMETLGTSLAIHFRAPLWELVGARRHVIYFLTGEPHNRSVLPTGPPDRWALAMPWDGPADEARVLTAGRIEDWIHAAAGVTDLPMRIEHMAVVRYGTALARTFRDGDAFLVGDAAHRVTPRGATGLNTAMRDGFDLGWRLGWVLRGWAGEGLLDGYERERRPIAEFNTARSSRADGSLLRTGTGLNADIGGRIPHVWVARGDALVSTLDLLGDGLTLFAGPEWSGTVPDARTGAPPTRVERLDAIAARGLGLTPGGALLSRPDGHPLALSNDVPGDQPALCRCSATTSLSSRSRERS